MGKRYGGGSFEDMRIREDLDVDDRSIVERIDSIHVTAGEADVADARTHARHTFRKDFRRSHERNPGGAAAF